MDDDLLIDAVRRQLNGVEFTVYERLRNDLIHLDAGRKKDGLLPAKDIRHVCHLNDFPLNDNTINAVLAACDIKVDGRVDYKDFCRFLSHADWKNDPYGTGAATDPDTAALLARGGTFGGASARGQPPARAPAPAPAAPVAYASGGSAAALDEVNLSRYDMTTLLEIISELRDENLVLKQRLEVYEKGGGGGGGQRQEPAAPRSQAAQQQQHRPPPPPQQQQQQQQQQQYTQRSVASTSRGGAGGSRPSSSSGARLFGVQSPVIPPIAGGSAALSAAPSSFRPPRAVDPRARDNEIFGAPKTPPRQVTSIREKRQSSAVERPSMDRALIERLANNAVQQLRQYNYTDHRSLREAFLAADRDRSGRINKQEVRAICRNKGLPVDDRVLSGLLNACDPNKDGGIDFVEFANLLNPPPIGAAGFNPRGAASPPRVDTYRANYKPVPSRQAPWGTY